MRRLFFLVRPPPRFAAVFLITLETRIADPLPGVKDDDGIRDFNRFRNLCEGTDWLRLRVLAVGIL
jgi:hypothetical protein